MYRYPLPPRPRGPVAVAVAGEKVTLAGKQQRSTKHNYPWNYYTTGSHMQGNYFQRTKQELREKRAEAYQEENGNCSRSPAEQKTRRNAGSSPVIWKTVAGV